MGGSVGKSGGAGGSGACGGNGGLSYTPTHPSSQSKALNTHDMQRGRKQERMPTHMSRGRGLVYSSDTQRTNIASKNPSVARPWRLFGFVLRGCHTRKAGDARAAFAFESRCPRRSSASQLPSSVRCRVVPRRVLTTALLHQHVRALLEQVPALGRVGHGVHAARSAWAAPHEQPASMGATLAAAAACTTVPPGCHSLDTLWWSRTPLTHGHGHGKSQTRSARVEGLRLGCAEGGRAHKGHGCINSMARTLRAAWQSGAWQRLAPVRYPAPTLPSSTRLLNIWDVRVSQLPPSRYDNRLCFANVEACGCSLQVCIEGRH
jgi:hypothetical protein